MTDYTTIPDTAFASDKPARAVDMRALRDNIPAQAEGAAGAPRTATIALADDAPISRLSASFSSSPQAVTGLNNYGRIRGMIRTQSGSISSTTLQFALSADGGSTWTGYANVQSMPVNGSSFLSFTVSLVTGVYHAFGNSGSENGTLSGGPFNAIRFRMADGLAGYSFNVEIYPTAGKAL